ncbi:flagellar assembly protein FliX [Sphingomonas sp. PAMC 26621]|uniref:flagellar assembly protein FliX n=1 Tax=Sphingomonas sp. PAMC 26621 TaxID=1112213 RepID=UPI000289410C|nr:flagellar assembly protein FliX [Sphingomonas sp. PAMC 26621]
MRVEGVSVPVQALLAALPRATAGFRATDAAPAATELPAPPRPLQAATSVQMLVALAATEPPRERRRRLVAEVDHGLGLLERLHAATAAGVAPPAMLTELADWAARFVPPDDPQAAAIARDVELRVRVELARHERHL